jgi:hypothetical protein
MDTRMHSQSETLLAEFNAAVADGNVGKVQEASTALIEHVWGGNVPSQEQWDAWLLIMRAAGRDDVCYRDHAPGVDGEPWRSPMGDD